MKNRTKTVWRVVILIVWLAGWTIAFQLVQAQTAPTTPTSNVTVISQDTPITLGMFISAISGTAALVWFLLADRNRVIAKFDAKMTQMSKDLSLQIDREIKRVQELIQAYIKRD